MESLIPSYVLEVLITTGKRGDIDSPVIASEVGQLRAYNRLGCLSWNEWDPVCEALSTDDHIALLKGIVMAGRFAGWDHGSVAAGIWVYRKLQTRISYKAAAELAAWVIARSDNPWMPFGTQKDRQLFVYYQDIDLRHVDHETVLVMAARYSEAARYAERQRQHLQRELERHQQAAKRRWVEKRRLDVNKHLKRKEEKDRIRKLIIATGKDCNEVTRLRLILEEKRLPLLSFPVAWTDVSEQSVKCLIKEEKSALLARLPNELKGPYKRYAKLAAYLLQPED